MIIMRKYGFFDETLAILGKMQDNNTIDINYVRSVKCNGFGRADRQGT